MYIVRFVRKLLLMIVSGTTTVILAACYGMGSAVEGDDYNVVVTIATHTSDNEPIQGLEVALACSSPHAEDEQHTDGAGEATSYLPLTIDLESCEATITDIDGAENGGEFASQTVKLTATDVYFAVEMSEK